MAIAVHGTPVTVSSATRTNTTVAVPSGASAGDLLVVALSIGNSSSVTPTAPAGQTWGSLGVTYSAPDPWSVQEWLFWHVIQAGESSYTFTHASAASQAYAEAYSGVDTTTPIDVTGQTNGQNLGSGSSGNATLTGVTTVTAGALAIINRGSWDGNGITPPAGWTERSDTPVLWYGTQTITSPGATGAITVSAGNNSTAYPWGIVLIVLRPADAAGPVTGSITADTPTVTVDTPTVSWSGTVTPPQFTGSITADAPTVSVAVPTMTWSGTVTAPAFTGTITADLPLVGVDVPTVAWSGTVTVPEFTGTMTADLPTVTVDPPEVAWAGTVTDPGSFTGTIDAATPPIVIDVPTLSWSGTVTVPVFTGAVDALTPEVTVAAPSVSWSGTVIAPSGATLVADLPPVTIGVPDVAWSGVVTVPEFTGDLQADLPSVAITVPTVAWAGSSSVPQVAGAITATLPPVTIGTPTVAWTGSLGEVTPTTAYLGNTPVQLRIGSIPISFR